MGKKRKFDRIEVVDIAHKGKSIGKTPEGEVVIVQGALPGEVISGLGLKKRQGLWQVIPQQTIKPSPWKTIAECPHFDSCGGCKWQQLDVSKQLELKQNQVYQAIARIAKEEPELLPIVPSPRSFEFRNKLEFSFSARRWLSDSEIRSGRTIINEGGVGFHPAGRFDKVVDIDTCLLMPDLVNNIRNRIRALSRKWEIAFYDNIKHTGKLRSLVVRMNRQSDIMLLLVYKGLTREEMALLLDETIADYPQIKTVFTLENDKLNDSIYDLEPKHYFGAAFIDERIGDLHFNIGPKSFFQTNVYQTEQLYAGVKEWAELDGDEIIFDLYSGIGSIALYIADQSDEVIAFESVEEAVADARLNARINGIENVRFYTGQLEKMVVDPQLTDLPKPDIIITDPPRAGMHKDVVRFILQQSPERIIYVSCNVATQARDISLLTHRYELVKVQPFDMFPHTAHVESLALLVRK